MEQHEQKTDQSAHPNLCSLLKGPITGRCGSKLGHLFPWSWILRPQNTFKGLLNHAYSELGGVCADFLFLFFGLLLYSE